MFFEYARKQRCYNYPNPCEDVTIPEKAIEEALVNALYGAPAAE